MELVSHLTLCVTATILPSNTLIKETVVRCDVLECYEFSLYLIKHNAMKMYGGVEA
jgi:hypothetical protein